MWIVAPLKKTKTGRIEFTDHEAIDFYLHEGAAREAVRSKLRSGDPLVGLFQCEGIYDAELQIKRVKIK